jgi:uncharacterized protein
VTLIEIEVLYALPERAVVRTFRLAPSAKVADALRLAAADPAFAGIDIAAAPVGLYGKLVSPEQTLQEGDRIEIYRPLALDPKAARRARAKQAASRSGRS